LTWPVVLHLREHTIGEAMRSTVRQEYFQEWNLLHRFEQGDALHYYRTDLLNFPFGQDISENVGISLNLFFHLPLKPFLDVFGRANLLVLIVLTLNGYFMFRLARRLTNDVWLGLAGGVFFAACPYLMLKLNQGFHQKIILFWMPLLWSAAIAAAERRRWRDGALAGLWFALMLFTYAQHAYYMLLLLALYEATEAWKAGDWRATLKQTAPLVVGIAAAAALFFWVVHETEPAFRQAWRKPFDDTYYLTGYFDLLRPLRFFPYRHLPERLVPYPLGLTLTLPALALAGLALRRRSAANFYLVGAAAFLIIALGGRLVIDDRFASLFGRALRLPYDFLLLDAPFGYRLGFPIRAMPVVFFCLAIAAAYALQTMSRHWRLAPALLAGVACAAFAADNLLLLPELYPPKVEAADFPDLYRQIRNEPGEAILNLPLARIESDYVYFSTIAQKKQVNLYLIPRRPVARSFVLEFPGADDPAEAKRRYLCELAAAGVRHIIAHPPFFAEYATKGPDNLPRLTRELGRSPLATLDEIAWLADWLGPPTPFDADRFRLYRLPAAPAFCAKPAGAS
jgi:hypothetical protein